MIVVEQWLKTLMDHFNRQTENQMIRQTKNQILESLVGYDGEPLVRINGLGEVGLRWKVQSFDPRTEMAILLTPRETRRATVHSADLTIVDIDKASRVSNEAFRALAEEGIIPGAHHPLNKHLLRHQDGYQDVTLKNGKRARIFRPGSSWGVDDHTNPNIKPLTQDGTIPIHSLDELIAYHDEREREMDERINEEMGITTKYEPPALFDEED